MPSSHNIPKVLLAILIVITIGVMPIDSYENGPLGDCGSSLATLEDGKLDVQLELTINDDSQGKFKVSFLDTGTINVHKHIDYTFAIEDQSGKEIFNAGPSSQPVLHTAEGVVIIPYTFQSKGDYTVNVTVHGINFVPITPSVASFSCYDIPEFPIGVVGVAAVMIGVIIIVSRYPKKYL